MDDESKEYSTTLMEEFDRSKANMKKMDVWYLINVLNIFTPSPSLCRLILGYRKSHGEYPLSLYDLVSYSIRACMCGVITNEIITDAIQAQIVNVENTGKILSCHVLYHQTMFFIQERRFPSDHELVQYMTQLANININPERYHQENKVLTPTENLFKLVPTVVDKEGECCLCLETICVGEEAFVLPCKHVYHCHEQNCVGGTIKTWLSENKSCPMCKAEVVL
jgi:E3 ubiquitin-protein ligase SDIR1